jgi:hypothetical protein
VTFSLGCTAASSPGATPHPLPPCHRGDRKVQGLGRNATGWLHSAVSRIAVEAIHADAEGQNHVPSSI